MYTCHMYVGLRSAVRIMSLGGGRKSVIKCKYNNNVYCIYGGEGE